MIKTIKTIKYMRLDELIKHIFDNDIKDESFSSNIKCEPYYEFKNTVYVHPNGTISLGLDKINSITDRDLFRVEVEEPITEDTVFELLIELFFDGEEYYSLEFTDKSIGYVKNKETTSIYGLIDGKLELIYERGIY